MLLSLGRPSRGCCQFRAYVRREYPYVDVGNHRTSSNQEDRGEHHWFYFLDEFLRELSPSSPDLIASAEYSRVRLPSTSSRASWSSVASHPPSYVTRLP